MSYVDSYSANDNDAVNPFAPSDFVVASIEERLVAWRQLDLQAREAQQALDAVGQAAADPRVMELVATAKTLRDRSDREFAAILRAVKHQ